MEVNGLVYSPAEWREKEEALSPAGKAVVFGEVSEGAAGKLSGLAFYVGDPWYVEATVEDLLEGTSTVWEVLAVASLSEAGIWRIVVDSSAPAKGVQPDLITVQELAEL